MQRQTDFDINNLFIERWSPRSFDSNHKMEKKDLETLLEAARWSPSCFNEQPWRFYYTLNGSDNFDKHLDWLVDANSAWAKRASALLFIVAKKTFSKNSKPNKHSWFDSGAAWMAFTMQARMMGLYTHGMAGIETDKINEGLGLDDDHEVICAVAVGKKADPSQLNSDQKEDEKPNSRKSLEDISFSLD